MFGILGLILGFKCNARCAHCLWGDRLDDGARMTDEEVRGYIDQGAALEGVNVVGFSGGEPFIFRRTMKEGMRHAWTQYGLPSGVSTNGYWGLTRERARAALAELQEVGLRQIQVSVDDFHLKDIPLERPTNVLHAALELGLDCYLSVTMTRRTRGKAYYLREMGLEEGPRLRVSVAAVTPTGYAASRIPDEDFSVRAGVPSNFCSILKHLNILPDGAVHVCCGAPFHAKELWVGNARTESLASITERVKDDALFLALRDATGPRILAEELRAMGRGDQLREGYVSSCDACQDILCRLGAGPALRERLSGKADSRRASRLLPLPVLPAVVAAPEAAAVS